MERAESTVVPLRNPDKEREQELVGRACDGDIGAFEDLYHSHTGRVYALCLRLCGDRGRAEDLTQETFVRAWRGLSGFRGESRLGSWLHRIAVNVVMRELKRHSGRESEMNEGFQPVDRSISSQGGLRDLEQAIEALPERARTVFVLHDIEGYSHEEVGQLAGMAPGTSKAQLHRARKLLQGSLAG